MYVGRYIPLWPGSPWLVPNVAEKVERNNLNQKAISKCKDSAMATLGKAKTRDSSCPPRKETACQKSERAKGDKKDV